VTMAVLSCSCMGSVLCTYSEWEMNLTVMMATMRWRHHQLRRGNITRGRNGCALRDFLLRNTGTPTKFAIITPQKRNG